MTTKMNLQTFMSLKNEVISYVQKQEEAEKTGISISVEDEESFLQRYEEIINLLSSHDLSEIDYDNWDGMILQSESLDFSQTNANLDFNLINFSVESEGKMNFKGCNIKNFDFENSKYDESSFDANFLKQNTDKFLDESIEKGVRDRYYEHQLTLSDILNNNEIKEKVTKGQLSYYLRDIVNAIGLEETLKLDSEFIDISGYWSSNIAKTYSGEKNAPALMLKIFEKARESILSDNSGDFTSRLGYNQDELGKAFKDSNSDLFLNENVPENIRENYYKRRLTLKIFSENQEYFKDVPISHAFNDYGRNKEFITLMGESIKDIYSQYGTILTKITDDYNTSQQVVMPNGNLTMEDKTEFIKNYMKEYLRQHPSSIVDLNEIKTWSELLSLNEIEVDASRRSLIEKYGIDVLIESGIKTTYFAVSNVDITTSLEEIKKMSEKIEITDIIKSRNKRELISKYGIDYLIELGVENTELFDRTINNLDEIKQLNEKIPLELIPIGSENTRESVCKFIEKYGIDNIIKLDKETNGIFSHPVWQKDSYLTLFATVDNIAKSEDKKELTYEEFEQLTFELLQKARKKDLRSKDYPDYDFIQGDFRKKHSEIFIDGNISAQLKKDFCFGALTCENIRKNPELIDILKDKDIIPAFSKLEISGYGSGSGLTMITESGQKLSVSATYNMAEILSNKWGKEEFLKFIANYGLCLDIGKFNANLSLNKEEIEKSIQDQIFKNITENKVKYHEELPNDFKLAHPELFIDSNISEEIKSKFYSGELKFDDIRQNPELAEILKDKNLQVCFNKYKRSTFPVQRNTLNKDEVGLIDVLPKEDFLKLMKNYGIYLENVKPELFKNGLEYKDLENITQESIYKSVISRQTYYSEDAPNFLKIEHPELFLDANVPEHLKLCFYDSYKSNSLEFYQYVSSNYPFNFEVLKSHPEYKEYLEGKNIQRAMPKNYSKLFEQFDIETLIKLGTKNPEMIDKIVASHKEEVLHTWYQSTGGKFVPHHVVMINFPTTKIDDFLSNGKKWSQLMKIDDYNVNDDGKAAILKASMAMGVFEGNDDSFNKTIELFTGLPKSIGEIDYQKALSSVGEDQKAIFEKSYKKDDNDEYILKINKQKNKNEYSSVRKILEKANISKILTLDKAHKIFDSFNMEYNADFANFFEENAVEILSNSEYTTDISSIQRQFKDIQTVNSGRRLTLDVAQSYIKSIVYDNIEIGNESLAETSKISGYSQQDFDKLQVLFNEGKTREFSSIPRIEGSIDGYTYEMLRVDDPLALTIGTLTDCCQNIHGAGRTSMEHSMVSPDGKIFCVRDKEKRIVAQSWFWRNKYTGCFDNIEIPDRIFRLYEKENPQEGKAGLTKEVLEVYKQATKDLMQEDKNVYDKLLDEKTITKEQYEGLLLGKVTIGLGYNDIKDAIVEDKNLKEDSELVQVQTSDRLIDPYTDASQQYIIVEREGIVKSNQDNLYVHQDTIRVYDEKNLSDTIVTTLQRMEANSNKRGKLSYMRESTSDKDLPKEKRLMNSIARGYGYEPEQTRIITTSKIALLYSSDDEKINLGDILSVPIGDESTEEQKKADNKLILNQIKRALRQINIEKKEIDINALSAENKLIYDTAVNEIKKEDDKRGER
jgi:hypothetical protein